MILRNKNINNQGYEKIVDRNGTGKEMLMDFGLLHLSNGQSHENQENCERIWILLKGKVQFKWENHTVDAERKSLLDEKPSSLRVSSDVLVSITALSETVELAVFKAPNERAFSSIFYGPDLVEESTLSAGKLGDVAERTIRIIVDDENGADSSLCCGEIINQAGRWSSYPPHHHPQPEIYHYRFIPEEGFGFSGHGEDVFKVHHGDTAMLLPDLTHPQVAAPGYTMFYLWAIPHLKDDRFKGNSRIFEQKHKWILEES